VFMCLPRVYLSVVQVNMSHLCVVRCLLCVRGFEMGSGLNCEWIHLLHSFDF